MSIDPSSPSPVASARRAERRRRAGAPDRPGRHRRRRGRAPSCSTTSLVVLVAEGHVLIEDLPGVGKTTLARALARSLDLQFARVQCTADLLPADVVGTNVFNQREDRFEFRPGPIFANVVLVDEINRASPKTQSGLLECMQERRVTVDVPHARAGAAVRRARHAEPGRVRGHLPAARGAGRPLHGPPVARLPVAGRRGRDARAPTRPATASTSCEPVAAAADVLAAQDAARRVHASDALRAYVVALLQPHARGPAGRARRQPARRPDAAARRQGAGAAATGRDHALPDDVQALAQLVLAHRIVLAPEALEATGEQRRRRRAGGDAGARSGSRCDAGRSRTALLGLVLVAGGGARSTPSRSTSPACAFAAPAAVGAAVGARSARAGCASSATVGVRRVVEEEPVRSTSSSRAGRLPLPSGAVDDPLLPAPAPLGRRAPARRVRDRRALRPARAQAAGAAAASSSATRSASPTRVVAGRRAPARGPRPAARSSRCGAARAAATAPGCAARRGRPAVAAEVDLDGLRPHREGAPASRIHWPALARGGELLERRLRADGDTRPLVVARPARAGRRGGRSTPRSAPPRRSPCTWRRAGGCALLLPGDRRPAAARARRCAGWPHLHVAPRAGRATSAASALAGLAAAPRPDRLRRRAAAPRGRRAALLHAPGGRRRPRRPRHASPAARAAVHRRGLHGLRARRAPHGARRMGARRSARRRPDERQRARRRRRRGAAAATRPRRARRRSPRLVGLRRRWRCSAALQWARAASRPGAPACDRAAGAARSRRARRAALLLAAALAAAAPSAARVVGERAGVARRRCSRSRCSPPACRCASSARALGRARRRPRARASAPLPELRVPYRGVDAWVRDRARRAAAACSLGPSRALAGLAAARPARRRGPRRSRPPWRSASLYAVPVVEHAAAAPVPRRRRASALLLGALPLAASALRARPASAAAARWSLSRAVAGAVVVRAAPRRRAARGSTTRRSPRRSSRPGPATFNWNHSYGPLDLAARRPRDRCASGRARRAYWKAVNLDELRRAALDAGRARADDDDRSRADDPDWVPDHRAWSIAGCAAAEFVVGGGTTLRIVPRAAHGRRARRPRDLLTATASRCAAATATAPTSTRRSPATRSCAGARRSYRPAARPRRAGLGSRAGDQLPARVPPGNLIGRSAACGSPGRGLGARARSLVAPAAAHVDGTGAADARARPYARVYALAQRCRAGATTPYDFVARGPRAASQRRRRLHRDPAAGAAPARRLPASATDAGYCQQFSGAMALLLRMGGDPGARRLGLHARAARAPTAASTSSRDLDAHSWVEVYFPAIGWVTFDPTPAASPARSQTSDAATGAGASARASGRAPRGAGARAVRRPPVRRRRPGRRASRPPARARAAR